MSSLPESSSKLIGRSSKTDNIFIPSLNMAFASLTLLTLFLSGVHSFFPNEIKEIKESIPYINPKQYLITKLTAAIPDDTFDDTSDDLTSCINTYYQLGGSDTGILCVSPTTITSDTEWLTVSWINVSFTGKYDWIGLFKLSDIFPHSKLILSFFLFSFLI